MGVWDSVKSGISGVFGGGGASNPLSGVFGWQGPAALPSSALSYIGGERANEQRTESAREQMRFQETMSNTAYQRAMRDMRAAGLNPILASRSPASTPGGAMPMIQDTITPAVQTGLQTMQTFSNTALQATQADLNAGEMMLKESQWQLNKVKEQITRNALPASEAVSKIAENVEAIVKSVDSVVGLSDGRAEKYRAMASDTLSEWMELAGRNGPKLIDAIKEKLGNLKRDTLEFIDKFTDYDTYKHMETR